MEDDLEKTAIIALLLRHAAAWTERRRLQERAEEIARRIAELDKQVSDCEVSFRVFGYDVKEPGVWRSLVDPLQDELKPRLERIGISTGSQTSPQDVIPPPEHPPIHDLVLRRLQELGEEGSKASNIRAFVEDAIRREIHEKTVGMTLYRLLRKGLVRREGHRWFYLPQDGQNPGADTPGQTSIFD